MGGNLWSPTTARIAGESSRLSGRLTRTLDAFTGDYYAARLALEKMEQGSRSKEVQEYLYALMDRLEQVQTGAPGSSYDASKTAHAVHISI